MITRPLMTLSANPANHALPCTHFGSRPHRDDRCQFCGHTRTEIEDAESALIHAMIAHGGSFASRLGDAWARADSGNAALLRASFGDLLWSFAPWAERDAWKA